MTAVITCAVEGIVDEAVVRRLVGEFGGEVKAVYGGKGKQSLRKLVGAYNHAARHAPWLMLVDLDEEQACAADLRDVWLPEREAGMCFRVAVHEVEAWLIADRDGLARFLRISPALVSRDPDSLVDAKGHVTNLARRSRARDIAADIVPRAGSGRSVGPAYASRLIEFIQDHWQPWLAAESSHSLKRCMNRLRDVMAGAA